MTGPIFTAGSGGGFEISYDAGDLAEIDKAIRHMPAVVAYCVQKAQETCDMADPDHFHVELHDNPEDKRPRAYCVPDDKGIHLELTDSVLLKSAISMQGR